MKYTMNVWRGNLITHRLKKSGNFEEFPDNPSILLDNDYTFNSYESAKQWKRSQSIVEVEGEKITVNSESGSLVRKYIEVHPHRIFKPKQKVFTKQQVASVLLSGDDSQNNSLIVDEDGFVHLVPFYQAREGRYPVRIETFGAGNGYVGSDSSLNEVKHIYTILLEGWAEHLETGEFVYQDYSQRSEEEVLRTIDEYYEKYR